MQVLCEDDHDTSPNTVSQDGNRLIHQIAHDESVSCLCQRHHFVSYHDWLGQWC